MRTASDTSQKKGELSLRTGHTTALHLEDAAAAYETGALSGLRSNRRTEAHPHSNDQFSDSYELYEESERKVESSIGHRPFTSGSGAAHKPDPNWQADSLLPGVMHRRSRSRPRHLNDAIQLAVELEAYNKAERKSYARPTAPEPGNDALAWTLDALNAKIDSLQLEVKSFKSSRAEDDAQLRPRVQEQQKLCYYCRKPGHIQRDCRAYQQSRPRENYAKDSGYGNQRDGMEAIQRAESNGYARNLNER
uniref:CCHC-type domain-containing protein n=1 Tax=Magallana gigas TaxID=29159 RepID=A0A8W8MHM6_MAGGI